MEILNVSKEILESMKARLEEAKANEGKERILVVNYIDDSIEYVIKGGINDLSK